MEIHTGAVEDYFAHATSDRPNKVSLEAGVELAQRAGPKRLRVTDYDMP